jgi:hypothetical protein
MLIGIWTFSLLAQGRATQSQEVMRQKLEASEHLLSALVTSNWVALDRQSRAEGSDRRARMGPDAVAGISNAHGSLRPINGCSDAGGGTP